MSWDAGAITSTMGIDISGFRQAMMQAESVASIFPSVVSSFIANPLLGIVDVAKHAGEAMVHFLADAVKETGKHFDDIGDMSANLGVTTQFLSTMGKVAELSNVDIQTLALGLKQLQERAADAMSGKDESAAKGFKEIGLSYKELQQIMSDPEKLFFRVSQGLSEISGQAQKVQAASDLMGRGGFRMIGLLTQGPEKIKQLQRQFTDLGASVSDQDAAMGDKWDLLTHQMSAGWEGIKKDLALPILDAILQDSDVWLVAMHELRDVARDIASIISTVAHGFADIARIVIPQNLLDQARASSPFAGTAGPSGSTAGGGGGGGGGGTATGAGNNLRIDNVSVHLPDKPLSDAEMGALLKKAIKDGENKQTATRTQQRVALAIGGRYPR